MNKYAGFLLLDLMVDIDRVKLEKSFSDTTIRNLEKIKMLLELLSKYVSFVVYLEDGDIDEKEFNEKIVLMTKRYVPKFGRANVKKDKR